MTNDRKLEAVMADIVEPELLQDRAPAAPPRRVQLPLVENAHTAEHGDEMTPERVAEILEREERALSPSAY